MKKLIKTILEAVVIVALTFGLTAVAVSAWDIEYENNLKKEFDLRYTHRFEEGYDLLDPTYINSVKAQMPKDFKFADWSEDYEVFDIEDGHCILNEDYQKEEEIFAKTMEFYSSSIKSGCVVDWEECYNITKAMYDFTE